MDLIFLQDSIQAIQILSIGLNINIFLFMKI